MSSRTTNLRSSIEGILFNWWQGLDQAACSRLASGLTSTLLWRLLSKDCNMVTSSKQQRNGCGFSNFSTQSFWDARIYVHVYREGTMGVGVEEMIFLHLELRGLFPPAVRLWPLIDTLTNYALSTAKRVHKRLYIRVTATMFCHSVMNTYTCPSRHGSILFL